MGEQVGCERRIEVFVKIQKKNLAGGELVRSGWGGGGGRSGRRGGQVGCEQRIEVFVRGGGATYL